MRPAAREILADWVNTLRKDLLWGEDDPLFPATRTALGATGQFEAVGLEDPWVSAQRRKLSAILFG